MVEEIENNRFYNVFENVQVHNESIPTLLCNSLLVLGDLTEHYALKVGLRVLILQTHHQKASEKFPL
jgi:hypothetical protein